MWFVLVVLISDHCAHNGDCHPALDVVPAIKEHWGCACDIIQPAVVQLTVMAVTVMAVTVMVSRFKKKYI
jgi:hypothetical protein